MLAIFGGCGSGPTLREAQLLFQKGETEASLEKIRDALRTNPTDPELRAAYLSLREKAIQGWLDNAARATQSNDPVAAEAYYRRILSLDAMNDRARAQLDAMARDQKNKMIIKEAKSLIATKDPVAAALKLRTVLATNPDNPEVRILLDSLENPSNKLSSDLALNMALQKKISMTFKDATIKQVFDVLSKEAGINFVFDKDVRPDSRVNISLKDATVKDAMEMAMTTSQLDSTIVGTNTFLIYPNTPAKAKDYKALLVRAFFLSNANAEDVAGTLKTIVKSRDVVVDKNKNMLIVRDTPDSIRIAERLIRLQDLPTPEVMLEIEILEINRDRLQDLGVQLPNQLTLTPLPSASGGAVTLDDLRSLRSSRIGATISPLSLNASRTDTDVKTLANPRIRAKNRETAKILIGDRIPNITSTSTATGFVAQNVQYLDVGLKLEITPVVSVDDEISIKVALEVSNISNQITTVSGTLAYQIGTRTASTVLRLRNGENQILAGLISNEDHLTTSKVPGLGDVPILGRLFSDKKMDVKKSEIVLSITPYILRNTPLQDLAALEFDSGTESKLTNSGMASAAANVSQTNAINTLTATTESTNAAAGAPANLMWTGPAQVKVGDVFQLQLQIGSSQPLTAVPYTLSYDPKAIDVLNLSEGEVLKQGGSPTTFSQRLDRGAGQIYITNSRTAPAGDNATTGGTGSLLNLTLKALSPANANVQVISMSPQSASNSGVSVALPSMFTISITPP